MVRTFDARPIPADVLERVLEAGRRAPSAGYSQGYAFVVLEGPEQTRRYWDVALPEERRDEFPFTGLLAAPAIVLPCAIPGAYLERYAEADKADAGLGDDRAAWPVPYWTVDTSFASMLVLLAAVDEGLGALFFGLFDQEPAVRLEFGIPDDVEMIGVIALGFPAASDRPSGSSVTRPRKPVSEVVHRGGW
jgi:nitroreductase